MRAPYVSTALAALLASAALWAQEAPVSLEPDARLECPADKPPAEAREPIFFRADRVEGKAGGAVEASGAVDIRTRQDTFNADWVLYDQQTEELWGRGNVRMRHRGDTVTGPEVRYRRTTETGRFEQPMFTLGEIGVRGSASEFLFVAPEQYQAVDASVTACPAGNDDWLLNARRIDIDRAADIGTAHDVSMRFLGTPVLYWPKIDFPLSRGRKSGFLAPTYGSSGTRGLEASVPYYWNIAPNYDATITPRLMTKRGVQVNAMFRYLQPSLSGDVTGEILPHDRQTDETRFGLLWRHNQDFSRWLPGLTGAVNMAKVSDDKYFTDLADRISATSITTLPREGTLAWNGTELSVVGRFQRFQTLQDPAAPILPPYNRTPQIVASGAWRDRGGFDYDLSAELVRFEHPSLLPAVRTFAYPAVSYPLRAPGWFLVPRAGVHVTNYDLGPHDKQFEDTTRVLPIASLDGGLVFERDTSLLGRAFVQTLEPRAYYVYIPYKDQRRIPVFDTAQADLNFVQLFSENKYLGPDRINDANQVTLALTTRFIAGDIGEQRLSAGIGQRYYFQDQRVTLLEPPRTSGISDVLVAASARIEREWTADVAVQWSPKQSQVERFNFGGRYQPAPDRVLNASYRYYRETIDAQGRPATIRQIDLSGSWPVASRWQLLGRWNYSLEDRRIVEAMGGIEYNEDCWTVRAVAQRLATSTETATNSFYFQLELSGLVRVGTNPMEVIRRNVPGYTKPGEGGRGAVDGTSFWSY